MQINKHNIRRLLATATPEQMILIRDLAKDALERYPYERREA